VKLSRTPCPVNRILFELAQRTGNGIPGVCRDKWQTFLTGNIEPRKQRGSTPAGLLWQTFQVVSGWGDCSQTTKATIEFLATRPRRIRNREVV
jgi:hypothetical protein